LMHSCKSNDLKKCCFAFVPKPRRLPRPIIALVTELLFSAAEQRTQQHERPANMKRTRAAAVKTCFRHLAAIAAQGALNRPTTNLLN
jgi:hypothetical protein